MSVFPDLPGADKDQVQQRLHGHEPGQSDHHGGTEQYVQLVKLNMACAMSLTF